MESHIDLSLVVGMSRPTKEEMRKMNDQLKRDELERAKTELMKQKEQSNTARITALSQRAGSVPPRIRSGVV